MNECRVTVLMCEFNTNLLQLKEAVESILNQSYEYFKFLIIDDGTSIDNKSYLYSLKDHRVQIVTNEVNIGLEHSLNKGVSLVDTEFIIRMDSDDIAHHTRIEKQVEFADKNKQYSIISTRANLIVDKKIVLALEGAGEIYKEDLLKRTPFVHPSMLIRAKDIKKIGGYPLYKRCEDYAMVMEMYVNNYKGIIMDEVLLNYRMDSNGFKKKKFKFRLIEYKMRKYYNKKLNYSFIKRFYRFKPIIIGLIPRFIYKLKK